MKFIKRANKEGVSVHFKMEKPLSTATQTLNAQIMLMLNGKTIIGVQAIEVKKTRIMLIGQIKHLSVIYILVNKNVFKQLETGQMKSMMRGKYVVISLPQTLLLLAR